MTTAFVTRAILSGLIVAIITLIARKSAGLGGLIASIPLVSTLAMIWLWRDTGDARLVADFAQSAFWYFLPTMPMFLLIPWMLRGGHGFWFSLASGIGLTMVLYLMAITIAGRFGMRL